MAGRVHRQSRLKHPSRDDQGGTWTATQVSQATNHLKLTPDPTNVRAKSDTDRRERSELTLDGDLDMRRLARRLAL